MRTSLLYIISYISILFWIFPAIRQYKSELFWYFLVTALYDPIGHILIAVRESSWYTILILDLILLFTVMQPHLKKSSARIILFVALAFTCISFFVSDIFPEYLGLSFYSIIIYYFVQRLLSFTAKTDKVNIFHLFLLLEEVSHVLKILAVLINPKTGLGFFVTTGIFEILIAVFFSIYREDNPKLHFNLKKV